MYYIFLKSEDPILSPPATPETANAMANTKMAEEKATTKVEGKAASKLKRVASSTIPKSNSTNGTGVHRLSAALNNYR